MERVLNGIKVLDLSRVLAGPYAAQNLADLGADVLKIEAPWGDDTRKWGPPFTNDFTGGRVAAYFLSCNRGKQIIRMNFKEERDKLNSLIKQSDVIIENFRPGTFRRFADEISENQILCSISGFGATGPRNSEPGYDLSIQARSGIMSITGEPNRPPVKVGVAWIDVITGLQATTAIMAALFHRERTGLGQRIDISLWDCAIAALVNQAQNQLTTKKDPLPMASAHPNLVPYRAFQASDGWFVLAVGSDDQWKRTSDILGLEMNEEWSKNEGRILHRAKIETILADIFIQNNRSHWEEILHGIPCAPVNTVGEALEDAQSLARGAIWNINGTDTLANPLRWMSLTPATPNIQPDTEFCL